MSDPVVTFNVEYIEQRLAGDFDEANRRLLIKWNEDSSAAAQANALASSRHIIVLAESALTIGKEAMLGAFFTFLSYCRDNAARPQEHLDVARAACRIFIARVSSELEERSVRQQNFGLQWEIMLPILQQLTADLQTALDGYLQDAIRGRHGDQQIVLPNAMRERVDEYMVVNIAAQHPRMGEAISPTVPEADDAPSLVSALTARMAVTPTAPGFIGSPGGEQGDALFGTSQSVSTVTPPADGATTIAPSAVVGMQDIVADGVVVGSAWVPPQSPPGAETLLPPIIGRLSATLEDADTVSPTGVVFPKQELIRLLEGVSPHDVERVFRAVAEARRHSVGGNNPPEDVEELVTDVVVARGVLLEELGTDQPRVSVIRLATRAFVRAAGWLGEQGRWLIALGVGGVAAGVGKKLGEDHAEQILTHLVAMESKLTAIVTPIAHFFASMHLPF
jgi:hypothetical protein